MFCFNTNQTTSESRRIEKELRKERKMLRKQVKVLLLGSGESGKSTFIKQMVIIHGRGEFTADEVRQYRQNIYMNVLLGMRTLVDARDKFGIPFDVAAREYKAKVVYDMGAGARTVDMWKFIEAVPLIEDLWEDTAIKLAYDRRHLFQISDSVKYFFEHIKRIAQIDYVPTNRDILMCRKATRGISDHLFTIQNVPFRFVDVGGQRSQRQKWFQCFEDITSILFMMASNEYDQVILEDRRTNRIRESLEVFQTIVNHYCFQGVSTILFLNKTDLLQDKISKSNFQEYFPEFRGNPAILQEVQYFLVNLFDLQRRRKDRPFFYHFTTAVDTENIRRVFKDCREIILEKNIKQLMLSS